VVPDLKQAECFYQAFGLTTANELKPSPSSPMAIRIAGAGLWRDRSRSFGYISVGAFPDDLERFRRRLEEQEFRWPIQPAWFENGLWFRDLDGMLMEIQVAEKSSPEEKAAPDNASVPAGMGGVPNRRSAAPVRPRRLSHILLFTRDVARTMKLYESIARCPYSAEALTRTSATERECRGGVGARREGAA
jgi:hypothetical protein